MLDRLQIFARVGAQPITDLVYECLSELTGKGRLTSPQTQAPLVNACELLAAGGAVAVLVQRRVHDPDFMAEFGAYYSRQFAPVDKFCTRVHFFKSVVNNGEDALSYIDRTGRESYLGFITLRPIIKSPVGASIIESSASDGFVRSIDQFPVHIAGREYCVSGTPFMQQDNAVGACAQAAIWMALRTLRKREGDRAYDPAQITDAATKYFVNGRTRPNRQGLTEQQMTEAIRAAGYSPHLIPLGDFWYHRNQQNMSQPQIDDAMIAIHPYVESEIPVVLILRPPSGGHAVVVIGHTWQQTPTALKQIKAISPNGFSLIFSHAVSWAPSFIVHNDNTGPYRRLAEVSLTDYSMQHGASAIPLLPADVFMSAEEAMALALEILGDIFVGFKEGGLKTEKEVQALASSFVVRLLLVEKRKLRRWAAETAMPNELKEHIRLMESPKRLWVFELHEAAQYGTHENVSANTLVGLVLIDSTGDDLVSSVMLLYLNLPAIVGLPHGVLVEWDLAAGIPKAGIQTIEAGPIAPLRA